MFCVGFFLVKVYGFYSIFWIHVVCEYLLPVHVFLFHSLNTILKILNLDKVQFINYSI